MTRLKEKIALVTGAASIPGLGSATAIRFAQEGARVFLTDIDEAGVNGVADDINKNGGNATAMSHDVSSEADWDEVFGEIIDRAGRLDVLVNNAGIALLRTIDILNTDDWMKQNDVNMNSVFYGTQRAVREMRSQGGGGSIINMSSIAGQVGMPGCAAYSASKGAVRMFSKSIAMETAAEKIRVNTVHPGVIMTNMQKTALVDNADAYDAIVNSIPMKEFGDPMDVANMNLFLASDESQYITGAEFVVDGGLIAQ